MSERVRYELRGAAGWITLASPETRNALTEDLVSGLGTHLRAAMDDPAVRVVVLTGEGPAFCAGADLKNRGEMGDRAATGSNPFIDIMKLMRHGPKPVICAVNGHAFGGGIGVVASGDIAIAVAGAKFSFSEVRLGLIPAMIAVVCLPKIGQHQLTRLFLTGERFDAERAKGYGLLHAVVAEDDLERAVEAEIALIARGGPIAVGEAKQLVRRVAALEEDAAFRWAQEKVDALFLTDEASEGMAAFREKRDASWIRDEDAS